MKKSERRKLVLISILTVSSVLGLARCSSQKEGAYTNGLNQIRAGKVDDAIETFSQLLGKNPSDSAARFGLGWAYQTKGLADPAAQQYNLAIAAATETLGFSYFNLGVLMQAKKKFPEALAAYQQVMAIQHHNADAAYNMAFIYAEQGLDHQALDHFAETIRRKPTHAWAHYHAAVSSLKLGKKEDAKKYLKKAIELDGSIKEAREKLKALEG